MLPVRRMIEVTVDAEGSIRIEQIDPVEELTFDAITLPHQDIPWLVEKLLNIMMRRKSVPDSKYEPKPN